MQVGELPLSSRIQERRDSLVAWPPQPSQEEKQKTAAPGHGGNKLEAGASRRRIHLLPSSGLAQGIQSPSGLQVHFALVPPFPLSCYSRPGALPPSPMKTKASATKNDADEDEAKPKKIRSSRNNRHRHNHSSSDSESPPRKRSKKHSKRVADKKSKRNKVRSSSRRHRRHSLSPIHSLSSSSSPSSIARHHSTCSSSASERSVSPPPKSRSRDVHKKKMRGRDRERDRKRRKARRSASSSSTSASSDSSRSRSKSKHRKGRTVAGTTGDKIEIDYDNRHASRSKKNMADDDDNDRDEEALATVAKKRDSDIDRYKKDLELESQPSKNANQTQDMEPAGGGNSDAEDLELILRQKALENFRKFRAAAAAGKPGTNEATGKEALIDVSQNASKEIPKARSSAVTHFQRQGSSLVMKNSTGSPRSEDCGNVTSRSWKQEGSAGMSHGAASPGTFEAGETGCATQPKGRTVEVTPSICQFRSPQDGRNSLSVMQRLESTPGSCASVNQRVLGSSAGASRVNGAPRVRSVVSIPAREGLDGSTYTTPPRPSENSAPVESSRDVGRPLIDINKAERTDGVGRKTSEASASNGSILSPAEGKSQVRTEDKDGAQFQKKTFSRMHDGEAVEVSYKVYIPKKTPALARRKLQR